MKQKWSADWKSSVQPRKQRKYRHNAPLHIRRKFLGARLSSEHMRQFGRRSLPIRKGDEVRLMRGKSRGLKGVVERIDLKKNKIYVDGIIAKKVDGSEVMKALEPSNLLITKPSMDDKKRQAILARTEERARALQAQRPKEKPKSRTKAEAGKAGDKEAKEKDVKATQAEAKDDKKGKPEHKESKQHHKAHEHKKHKTNEHKEHNDHKKAEKKEHKK